VKREFANHVQNVQIAMTVVDDVIVAIDMTDVIVAIDMTAANAEISLANAEQLLPIQSFYLAANL
jgi:hypothetical protein